ncbi:MAG: 6,7-dimethyl-8-ribityllumazine synthase [Candidatus Eremiobacteraeota bacterium]|nr:6,7-dimethyl-8-ribityllumazine synthase [Candidatus Eremiobacteraeota bacterium]
MKKPAPGARPNCAGRRFALVVATFYPELAERLVDGAKRGLHDCGVADGDVDVYEVPGCFELPLACRNIFESQRYHALVALGAVVRGETPHFDYVAGECARGIMDVQLSTGTPIGFGVLTTDSYDQAEERADPKRGDKGYDAAIAAASLVGITAGLPRAGFR